MMLLLLLRVLLVGRRSHGRRLGLHSPGHVVLLLLLRRVLVAGRRSH